MKNIMLFFLLIIPAFLSAQLGVKAGFNFANITHASEINSSTRAGFHLGILYGSSKGLLGSRTELLFSRQGYNFKTNTNTGKVDLDYILLPQFIAINITPLVQIQAGGQIAYLLNANVDTTTSTGNSTVDMALDLYNRIDFGLGGGVEVHPLKSLLVGARINLSLGRLYKTPEPGEQYSFIPEINAKNNLFQLYAGLKFGG